MAMVAWMQEGFLVNLALASGWIRCFRAIASDYIWKGSIPGVAGSMHDACNVANLRTLHRLRCGWNITPICEMVSYGFLWFRRFFFIHREKKNWQIITKLDETIKNHRKPYEKHCKPYGDWPARLRRLWFSMVLVWFRMVSCGFNDFLKYSLWKETGE